MWVRRGRAKTDRGEVMRSIDLKAPRTPGAAIAVEQTEVDGLTVADPVPTDELVLEDLLIEDVSIDGMCGVY